MRVTGDLLQLTSNNDLDVILISHRRICLGLFRQLIIRTASQFLFHCLKASGSLDRSAGFGRPIVLHFAMASLIISNDILISFVYQSSITVYTQTAIMRFGSSTNNR